MRIFFPKVDELVVFVLMSACSQLGKIMNVLAGLVNMNVKCGNLEMTIILFESMAVRDVLMQGHCLHGC